MAGRWGRADFRQLQQLERQIDKLEKADFDKFCREAVKELAARLLAKVIKRTPVGDYPPGSGKMGGTLRRGWTVGEVIKEGDCYQVEIVNPVEYASYVEYGHRTANGKGWVPGHFMLTISEQQVENIMPGLLEKRLYELIKRLF